MILTTMFDNETVASSLSTLHSALAADKTDKDANKDNHNLMKCCRHGFIPSLCIAVIFSGEYFLSVLQIYFFFASSLLLRK